MLKEVVQSILPWILFYGLTGSTPQQFDTAIIVAAIAAIIFELPGLKKGFLLSYGTLLFFIFMFIAVIILKIQWIAKFSWVFANGTLAAIAWLSIVIRQPFTLQYAKQQVAQDKWQHPLFLKINYLLTLVWGLIFLLGLCLPILKLYIASFDSWQYEIISYLPCIFGIWFTTWFPNWYKAKYAK